MAAYGWRATRVRAHPSSSSYRLCPAGRPAKITNGVRVSVTQSKMPVFPFGAVYFRKSNPPEGDWAHDYATAAEDGMNVFRHWFLWSAIEVAPDQYDWADYDRQLDLAAEHGIQTIIAEMITAAPEWAFRHYAHARYERRNGQLVGIVTRHDLVHAIRDARQQIRQVLLADVTSHAQGQANSPKASAAPLESRSV